MWLSFLFLLHLSLEIQSVLITTVWTYLIKKKED